MSPGDSWPLPAAVLFDMDGLLVDSEPTWTVAESELARSLGREFTPEVKAAMIGNRLDAAVPILLRHLGVEADPAETSEWLLRRMAELFAAELPVQPGAIDLLAALRAIGVPCALVSSSYRVLVDAVLRWLPDGTFDFTLAGDEVTHAKPHPEPYLTAAEALGVLPGACVVLEDSSTGAISAQAAGCPVILVPTLVGTEQPSDSPWPKVRSLVELSPEALACVMATGLLPSA